MVERLRSAYGWDALQSYRFVIFAYTGLGLIKLLSTVFLSKDCEVEKEKQDEEPSDDPSETSPLLTASRNIEPQKTESSLIPRLSKKSSIILIKLCILFMIDSMASGLVPQYVLLVQSLEYNYEVLANWSCVIDLGLLTFSTKSSIFGRESWEHSSSQRVLFRRSLTWLALLYRNESGLSRYSFLPAF